HGQHSVVKLPQGEPIAKSLLCLFAELDDPQLPNHVRTGLARIHDISFDLARLDSEIDRLLTGPLLRMQTRVDHQPAGSKQLVFEMTEPALEILAIPSRH